MTEDNLCALRLSTIHNRPHNNHIAYMSKYFRQLTWRVFQDLIGLRQDPLSPSEGVSHVDGHLDGILDGNLDGNLEGHLDGQIYGHVERNV